ncbi:MAG TPA: type II and III secretion system protein family protein [Longimicrobiales bacterium]|nr:type II and III secretion system protein family protein [Longimicrobiales bacterium]
MSRAFGEVFQRIMLCILLAGGVSALAALPTAAQQVQSTGVVTVARGQSALLTQPRAVQRISIADTTIANAFLVSPQELLVNGIGLGTTTLIIWDQTGGRRTYSVEVTADASALQRTLDTLFPAEDVRITAVGNMLILTGTVSDLQAVRQIRELAGSTGAQVVDNMQVPGAQQIMLQVRIAEASRNAIREFGAELAARNPQNITGEGGDWFIETFSDGLMRLLMLEPNASVEAVLRGFRTTGEVRTLAEPNLIALDGTEASFLAGGEFPFPMAQGEFGRVTVEWREFGVRLNFLPTIMPSGAIRLRVAPEVSSLDFSTGLVISGFAIPSMLTRKAETTVELLHGQTFAIAGLLDNNTLESVTRLPILGDIPIIGALFRNKNRREDRMELLVLVTPWLVAPYDEAPPIPPGEPDTWSRDRHMRPPVPHPLPVPQRRVPPPNDGAR